MASTLSDRPKAATPAVKTTRDPFISLRDEMNDLISRMWNGLETQPTMQQLSPALDVSETDNAFEVRMDSPGMDAKDFDIQVHGNAITLSGRRQEEKEEKGKTYHRVERRSGCFSRTLTLPCDINEDEVAAEYTNGVLLVKLPKCENSKPKKISVKS